MTQNPPSLKEGIQNFAVSGFTIGATAAGLKPNGKLDLCVLVSDRPSTAAGVFTRNRIVGEPVKLDRLHLKHATHRAVVVNAKYSNVCTGDEGYRNAREMASTLADLVGCEPEEVFVASTGIIGQQVPMERALPGIRAAFEARATDGWEQAAHAIMTTDTFPKAVSRTVQVNGTTVTLGGIAKGSGMIHPNMATMLCFLATDAAIEKHTLQEMLRRVADRSFNCVTVDGDTSTSDSMILLANGLGATRLFRGRDPTCAPSSKRSRTFASNWPAPSHAMAKGRNTSSPSRSRAPAPTRPRTRSPRRWPPLRWSRRPSPGATPTGAASPPPQAARGCPSRPTA
jgi:glutamate N-acetyltransferase/amino-acid N-acetyltransferase